METIPSLLHLQKSPPRPPATPAVSSRRNHPSHHRDHASSNPKPRPRLLLRPTLNRDHSSSTFQKSPP
ncbi:hypothetical protein CASFOL_028959 [Castilleja foliolosa]|uniref:Uncharacterized protein n=1 Tax=Castilleja foliolosa TaxID=1961234 RepID=A0ABD3CEZ5_9LAMI